jgi:hypothetical protein
VNVGWNSGPEAAVKLSALFIPRIVSPPIKETAALVMCITLHHKEFPTIPSTSSTFDFAEIPASDAQHGQAAPPAPYCRTEYMVNRMLLHPGCWSLTRRSLVRKLTLAVAFAALTLSACKKTGEGQYEVQKPVVGTETDTVNTPSVETGTVKDTINVPKVETEKKEVTLPKVEVKKPKE